MNYTCASCAGMRAQRPIRTREDLRALADIIAAEIAADRIEEADLEAFAKYHPTSFADLREGKLDDIVFCIVHCTLCGQEYSLSCETYHGRGGRWSLFEPRKAR